MATSRSATRRPRSTAAPPGGRAVTPIAFVHAMLGAYHRYRKDPAGALEEAQITPEMLRNPEARITAWQMETFSRLAMQQLDDEALGWFSRPLPWGSYGMLARASLTAPNLGVALKRWCRHHGLLTRDIVFTLQESGGLARICIEEHRKLGELREFCLLTSLRNLHGYASWVVDSRLPLASADFPFPAPPHADVYRPLFPGPVRFGAPQAGFTFDAQYLRLPVRRDEQALQAMLQHAVRLIVLPYRRDRLLVQRVQELLRTRSRELRTAEEIARELHLSVRSLHRQLQQEGASLQALKDDARRERAIALLTRTCKPVKQVATAVGFDNEKSFSRAFRAWTGLSPLQFRQMTLAPADPH
ncbi:MAG TPA: AraC family transcriptional regulator [Burkholderiaceae bacterium]|nr:AraC family transcriptional regulator [Burkholderiaceae bacterium]